MIKITDDTGKQSIIDTGVVKFRVYKKRPVCVLACQMDQDFSVKTLEGEMSAPAGAWLIMGVNGELYPCSDEIFNKTYDKASEFGKPDEELLKKESLGEIKTKPKKSWFDSIVNKIVRLFT